MAQRGRPREPGQLRCADPNRLLRAETGRRGPAVTVVPPRTLDLASSFTMAPRTLQIRGNLGETYKDVFTPEAVEALHALAEFDADRKALMAARMDRRLARARNRQPIAFLDPDAYIARTRIRVADARAGEFTG